MTLFIPSSDFQNSRYLLSSLLYLVDSLCAILAFCLSYNISALEMILDKTMSYNIALRYLRLNHVLEHIPNWHIAALEMVLGYFRP
jgi:hypothetical protein